MLGAGTVINPIIKIVTTIAILAAVYVFIIKPTLDTTNNAFDSFSNSFDGALDDLPGGIQSRIDDALNSSDATGRLQDCINGAIDGTNVNQRRINRCVERFGS